MSVYELGNISYQNIELNTEIVTIVLPMLRTQRFFNYTINTQKLIEYYEKNDNGKNIELYNLYKNPSKYSMKDFKNFVLKLKHCQTHLIIQTLLHFFINIIYRFVKVNENKFDTYDENLKEICFLRNKCAELEEKLNNYENKNNEKNKKNKEMNNYFSIFNEKINNVLEEYNSRIIQNLERIKTIKEKVIKINETKNDVERMKINALFKGQEDKLVKLTKEKNEEIEALKKMLFESELKDLKNNNKNHNVMEENYKDKQNDIVKDDYLKYFCYDSFIKNNNTFKTKEEVMEMLRKSKKKIFKGKYALYEYPWFQYYSQLYLIREGLFGSENLYCD